MINVNLYGKFHSKFQAWDLYYHVFRRIDKQLPSLTTLDLQARFYYQVYSPLIFVE